MSIYWKSGHILWNSGHIAHSSTCCCSPHICINICNYNKWSDTARDAKINGNTLSAPTIHVNGACGGGFYSNVNPLPAYCSLGLASGGAGLQCCGSQVGGTSSTCTGCDGQSYGGRTCTGGVYPATGCKGEDCGCFNAGCYSNQQTNCSLGDCSGDLTKANFPSSYLVTGTNTFTSAMTASGRCSGDFGCVQIFKLKIVSGAWKLDTTLVNSTYGSGTFTANFTL